MKKCTKAYYAEYRKKNRKKIKDRQRKWNEDHKDELKAYKKQYRQDNKEHIRDLSDNWIELNRDRHMEYTRDYYRRRRKEPIAKAKYRLQALIRSSLVNNGYSKTSKSAEILGGDFETVWGHLKKTWSENYGRNLEATDKYEIHHIIYCKTATTEEELIKLQHHTNLRLLTPKDHKELHRQFK